jgi:hypothetical protein
MLQCNMGMSSFKEKLCAGSISGKGGTAEKGVSTVPMLGDWGRGIPGPLTMRVGFGKD